MFEEMSNYYANFILARMLQLPHDISTSRVTKLRPKWISYIYDIFHILVILPYSLCDGIVNLKN